MPQLSGGPAAQAGAAPLPLVEARGLIKEYARRNGVARVVDDVSFAIQPAPVLPMLQPFTRAMKRPSPVSTCTASPASR